MNFIKIIFHKYLQWTATIYLHSNPNFVMEIFLLFVVLLIYICQHIQVTKISKHILRLKPHTIYCKTLSGINSKDSTCTSITPYHRPFLFVNPSSTVAYKRQTDSESSKSQLGWGLPSQIANEQQQMKKRLTNQLVDLTPEQFVKIDKERKLQEKVLDTANISLCTLCKNVIKKKFSTKTINRQIEIVRESLECNKMSLEGKYLGLKTKALTRSLFYILENLISNSSLKNPLPFKGDITTLALDAADLSEINNDNKDFEDWNTNTSGCYSNNTNYVENIITSEDKHREYLDT